MPRDWTEEKIASMVKEGRGHGAGANYRPWVEIRDFSSLGRKHLVPGTRFGRAIHLLSNIEHGLYLLLERSRDVLELYEQFPLEREITQDVAARLGIAHPCYPRTTVPAILTVDFMTVLSRDGRVGPEAFDCKDDSAIEDERTIAKLEIARAALELMEIPHHLVLDSTLPSQKVANLQWLQQALVRPGEVEPSPGYFEEMSQRFQRHVATAARATPRKLLHQSCSEFDELHAADPGTGLRVARILIVRREIEVDLDRHSLVDAELSSFRFAPVRRFGTVGAAS